ncbi:hypothetical protein OIT44_02790 [Weissella ceti]|uniref:Uncharacterized protein n=1 Tax=Weissella ceti TaxID=759620 RepID=A0ABT3E3K7_9LACO|nr:hypothetical protein [Weissella ceti]MCW0952998.1 hypothetical protein [Weissella ceti]QVK11544.1 hypothetical protein KHQ31_04800 [Weissella ceti]
MTEEIPICRVSDPDTGVAGYARTHIDAIDDLPELYSKEEVDELLSQLALSLTSPDGTVWVAEISNDGKLSWLRKEVE